MIFILLGLLSLTGKAHIPLPLHLGPLLLDNFCGCQNLRWICRAHAQEPTKYTGQKGSFIFEKAGPFTPT
jgi:hypothetical protein